MILNRFVCGLLTVFWATPLFSVGAPPKDVEPNPPLPENLSVRINDSIRVVFNNAYETLVTDNERIAKADPHSTGKELLRAIRSARSSLHVCVFNFDFWPVVNELIAAKQRGVQVEIVADSDELLMKSGPGGLKKTTVALEQAGIPLVGDQRQALMHNKFMIIDEQEVWTGSMNFSAASLLRDNNNALWIRSRKLASDYETEFRRLFDLNLFGPNPHEIPHPSVRVGWTTTIRPYFSPGDGARDAIIDELKKSRKSIRFMAFSLTDHRIGDLLLEKARAGVDVRGVMDDCMIEPTSLFDELRRHHLAVFRDGNQALLHHKVIIIDDRVAITGAYNFSASADENNNENLLIVRSARVARAYLREYACIENAARLHTNIPPYNHPACMHAIKTSDP